MTTDIEATKSKRPRRALSMKFRFLATVILAIVVITVFVGGMSIYEVDSYIHAQAEDFVKVTSTNESTQINNSLHNMEKSVKIMESYLIGFFTSEEAVSNRTLQDRVVERAEQMFIDIAQHTSTEGAISYYFRLNPEISSGTAGLFYSKQNGEFVPFPTTDLSLYDKDDVEHVGWFWQPYEAGEAIWMQPYYNRNNEFLMISYVIPMYFEDSFIGVVGMDFDYMVLSDRVHQIKIYENGFAHLESEGKVICNNVHESEDIDPDDYMRVSTELVNGMTLVLSASLDDIKQIRYDITFNIICAVLILSALFILIAFFVVKRIVDPLNKLTAASMEFSKGNYNAEIAQSNTLEIKLLSSAFTDMAKRLREREEHLHLSANRDSLTGLRNTTSYASWSAKFDEEIAGGHGSFGVVVLDLNELKKTNDKHGHDVGNELIVAAARLISDVFKRSPVFRIGGDEFLVVLQNTDLENRERLFVELRTRCSATVVNEVEKIPLSIALGFAMFDPGIDASFEHVFKRADDAMYENKREMKGLSN